jgi:hypothetical protein
MDMTHKRASHVMNKFNEDAAIGAIITAALGASGAGAVFSAISGIIAGYYWWIASKLQTCLSEHPKRGVKLKFVWGYPKVEKE